MAETSIMLGRESCFSRLLAQSESVSVIEEKKMRKALPGSDDLGSLFYEAGLTIARNFSEAKLNRFRQFMRAITKVKLTSSGSSNSCFSNS